MKSVKWFSAVSTYSKLDNSMFKSSRPKVGLWVRLSKDEDRCLVSIRWSKYNYWTWNLPQNIPFSNELTIHSTSVRRPFCSTSVLFNVRSVQHPFCSTSFLFNICSVQRPFCSMSARHPFNIRSTSVRLPFDFCSTFVWDEHVHVNSILENWCSKNQHSIIRLFNFHRDVNIYFYKNVWPCVQNEVLCNFCLY